MGPSEVLCSAFAPGLIGLLVEGSILFLLLGRGGTGVALDVRRLLLVERGHAELLVDQGLVFAARRTVAVVGVVAEGRLVKVTQVGHHSVHSAQETLVFCSTVERRLVSASEPRDTLTFDDVELVAAAAEASDCLAEVLGQNLQSPVRFLAADENFTDLTNAYQFHASFKNGISLPFVLPLIIALSNYCLCL